MSSDADLEGRVALVTGGGRGIGRGIALELAEKRRSAGCRSARNPASRSSRRAEIGVLAIQADVSERADVERMVAQTEEELGPLDLLVNNAGIAIWEDAAWELDPEEWWHVLEVNVLGVYLGCRALIPGMIGARAADASSTSRAAPPTFREARRRPTAPARLRCTASARPWRGSSSQILVFSISPGLVRTEMTGDSFGVDAPWTPPELAPLIVSTLASSSWMPFPALPPRRARHIGDCAARAAEIVAEDLNAIRLQALEGCRWPRSKPASTSRPRRSNRYDGPDHAVVGQARATDADRGGPRRTSPLRSRRRQEAAESAGVAVEELPAPAWGRRGRSTEYEERSGQEPPNSG